MPRKKYRTSSIPPAMWKGGPWPKCMFMSCDRPRRVAIRGGRTVLGSPLLTCDLPEHVGSNEIGHERKRIARRAGVCMKVDCRSPVAMLTKKGLRGKRDILCEEHRDETNERRRFIAARNKSKWSETMSKGQIVIWTAEADKILNESKAEAEKFGIGKGQWAIANYHLRTKLGLKLTEVAVKTRWYKLRAEAKAADERARIAKIDKAAANSPAIPIRANGGETQLEFGASKDSSHLEYRQRVLAYLVNIEKLVAKLVKDLG
jgi:hypothetical protein